MSRKESIQKVEDDLHEAYRHINDVIFRCDLELSEREEINEIRVGITGALLKLVKKRIKIENERAE
ncbi:hypothetical protein JQ662_000228 [Listeria monocytogenes]|nr:hypothetical protein [Listeria monocytogenes]